MSGGLGLAWRYISDWFTCLSTLGGPKDKGLDIVVLLPILEISSKTPQNPKL